MRRTRLTPWFKLSAWILVFSLCWQQAAYADPDGFLKQALAPWNTTADSSDSLKRTPVADESQEQQGSPEPQGIWSRRFGVVLSVFAGTTLLLGAGAALTEFHLVPFDLNFFRFLNEIKKQSPLWHWSVDGAFAGVMAAFVSDFARRWMIQDETMKEPSHPRVTPWRALILFGWNFLFGFGFSAHLMYLNDWLPAEGPYLYPTLRTLLNMALGGGIVYFLSTAFVYAPLVRWAAGEKSKERQDPGIAKKTRKQYNFPGQLAKYVDGVLLLLTLQLIVSYIVHNVFGAEAVIDAIGDFRVMFGWTAFFIIGLLKMVLSHLPSAGADERVFKIINWSAVGLVFFAGYWGSFFLWAGGVLSLSIIPFLAVGSLPIYLLAVFFAQDPWQWRNRSLSLEWVKRAKRADVEEVSLPLIWFVWRELVHLDKHWTLKPRELLPARVNKRNNDQRIQRVTQEIIEGKEARVCFVCTQGKNRSAVIGMILRHLLADDGKSNVTVKSAGLFVDPPLTWRSTFSKRWREELGKIGVAPELIEDFRVQPLTSTDLIQADLVIVMGRVHQEAVERWILQEGLDPEISGKVVQFREFLLAQAQDSPIRDKFEAVANGLLLGNGKVRDPGKRIQISHGDFAARVMDTLRFIFFNEAMRPERGLAAAL